MEKKITLLFFITLVFEWTNLGFLVKCKNAIYTKTLRGYAKNQGPRNVDAPVASNEFFNSDSNRA